VVESADAVDPAAGHGCLLRLSPLRRHYVEQVACSLNRQRNATRKLSPVGLKSDEPAFAQYWGSHHERAERRQFHRNPPSHPISLAASTLQYLRRRVIL
jgi:hypothetical protein